MTEKHVFDDLDALRRAGAEDEKPRKSRTKKGAPRAKSGGPKNHRYIKMREQQAVKGFVALKCPQALVWYAILYLVSVRKSRTVILSNQWLAAMGVSRWMKKRALDRLVRAKLIRTTQFNNQSPKVTLL